MLPVILMGIEVLRIDAALANCPACLQTGMVRDVVLAAVVASLACRDENGTDIFRPYSTPNSFREVQICPYPSPNIQHPIPYPYPNT